MQPYEGTTDQTTSARSRARLDCKAALAAIDRAVEKHGASAEPELVRATHCLVALRDHLITEQRAKHRSIAQALAHTNAVLSLLFGIEYPISGMHWDRLEQVRQALAELSSDARLA